MVLELRFFVAFHPTDLALVFDRFPELASHRRFIIASPTAQNGTYRPGNNTTELEDDDLLLTMFPPSNWNGLA